MSDERKDGGPAFPRAYAPHIEKVEGTWNYIYPRKEVGETEMPDPGMTLRDYMAAKALSALLSSGTTIEEPVEKNAALSAYRFADAMLKARNS